MYTPRATQFKQIVTRINHSKGFHSTTSIHNFLIGFLTLRQYKALSGLSAYLLTGFRSGLRACRSLICDAIAAPDGSGGAGVAGADAGVAGSMIVII